MIYLGEPKKISLRDLSASGSPAKILENGEVILNEVHSEFVPEAVQPGPPGGLTTQIAHQPIKPIQKSKVQEISEIPGAIALQRPKEAIVRSHVPPSNPGSIANQIHERHKRQVLQNPPKPKAQRPKKIKKVFLYFIYD